MPYIGKSPSQGVRTRYYYTVSAGATSVSGSDDNSNTLVFSDGNYCDVSLNGVTLVAGTDYNTTTANTIAGLSAMSANDVVEVVVYDTFSIFSGNINSDLAVGGDLAVTGTTTLSSNANFSDNAKAVFGAGTEMELYSDGSTGYMDTALFIVANAAHTNNIAKFIQSGAVELYHNNSLKFTTASDGIGVTGDIVFSGSGNGICLGATSNTAANTLDDYEEGTHNPTDSSGASLTFSTFTGAYTKIGNVVCFQAKVIYPSTSNGSEARISLPFVVGAPHANYYPSGKNDANGNTSASLTLGVTGQSYAIFKNDSGGSTATNANLSGANINIALTYKTT